MKKVSITIFLILLNFVVFAQIFDSHGFGNLHTLKNNQIVLGVNADYFLGSNALTAEFGNALLQNKFIDDDLKKSNSIKDNNYYGNYLNTSVYFAKMNDTMWNVPKMGYRISLNYNNVRNIFFTKDFYNLMFFGNKKYENKTADLSDLEYNNVTYQSIEFGLFKKFEQANTGYHTLYIGLSVIKGQEYQYFYTLNSSMFTAESGEYIDFDLFSSYYVSDTTSSNFADFSGMGVSANFYWAFENTDKNYRLEITLAELGFVSWFKNPVSYFADTNIRFEGKEIDNIFNPGDDNYNQDSLFNLIYSEKNNDNFIKSLPKKFNVKFSKSMLNNKYIATAGAGYYFSSNQYMPAMFLNNKFIFSPSLNLSLLLSYGGYTNFGLGFGIGFKLSEKFIVDVATSNFAGAVMPDNTYSQSAFISLRYLIK